MSDILTLQKINYQVQEQQILKDIDLSVAEQEFLLITGPSGSGKSTLLRIIATLLTPTSGTLLFQGKDVATMDPVAYRKEVSYCFQQPALFGDTVQDNLAFPFQIRQKAFDRDKALNALKQVDLTEDYLTKSINDLSGGEKQRVALIRNLMFLPKVLLLDEVTAGLDENNKQIVHRLITNLSEQHHITTIVVSHDAEEIKNAKNLRIIESGEWRDSDEQSSGK